MQGKTKFKGNNKDEQGLVCLNQTHACLITKLALKCVNSTEMYLPFLCVLAFFLQSSSNDR